MPVQAEDGGADWLLDVLAHPPAGNNTVCKEVSGMNSQKAAILENLTSHFPAQSNRWRWGASRCLQRTCSLAATTSRSEQRGWSWGWPGWASMSPLSGSTRRHYDPLHKSLYDYCQEPSQYLQKKEDFTHIFIFVHNINMFKGTAQHSGKLNYLFP